MAGRVFFIGESTQTTFSNASFGVILVGGDTVKVSADRKTRLCFQEFVGSENNPIVVVNSGGRVHIKSTSFSAIQFENCKYIKIAGNGEPAFHFGFHLQGPGFGLSFTELSSDCEAEFLEIDSCSLGIHAKKDYWYAPPIPYPVFKNLAIHDNYIHDCCEGMYIGETKSPGMEFRHLRIYNNVVTNSGRESFQIANSVEDVEVYNNFCYNSGLDGVFAQTNNSQLGGNSIGRFYNNIFIKAPSFGAMILGMGDMFIENNYFEDNEGCFADSRYIPVPDSPLKINNNYFRKTKGGQILKLLNSVNDISVVGNRYNTNVPFVNIGKDTSTFYAYHDNNMQSVDSLQYTIEHGEFKLSINTPQKYDKLGPIAGLIHTFNSTPRLDSIADIIVNIGDSIDFPIYAHTEDGDSVFYYAKSLPFFASIIQGSNGHAKLRIVAQNQGKGVYFSSINVSDHSHNSTARQKVKIAIKDPLNLPVKFNLQNEINIEAATKLRFNISGFDPDGDSIRYTVSGLTYFMSFTANRDSAFLIVQPTYINTGTYQLVIKAEDGYSAAIVDTLVVNVVSPIFSTGRIVYRVNYGNNEVVDSPFDWQKDYGDYRSYEANYSMGTGSATWTGANSTDAPNNIFGPFRYTGVGMQDMRFEYPCENGRYQVNLFFAERSVEVSNNAIGTFGVYLEDSLMQDSLNIYKEVGYNALKKSFVIDVRDKSVSLKLRKIINWAKINGVEIIYKDAINMPPVIDDILNRTIYEGDTLIIKPHITDDAFNDGDSVSVSLSSSPSFVTVEKVNGEYTIQCVPNFEASGTYPINLIISDGLLTVLESFYLTVGDFHFSPPVWTSTNKTVITEGVKDTITVTFIDPDNDNMTLSATSIPSFGQFLSAGNGIGKIILTPGYSDAGAYSVRIVALDSFGYETTSDISFTVADGYEVVRIPLSATMITDLGGSYFSNVPSNWINEQTLDPMLNQHPTSSAWTANSNALPCQFYINLGHKYVIKKMYFHDTYNIGTLYVAFGVPELWSSLFSLYTNNFNTWRFVNTDVATQYLKFSITDLSSPQVNELAIYGYLAPNDVSVEWKGGKTVKSLYEIESSENELPESKIFFDKSSSTLNVITTESKFNVEIFTLTGTLVDVSGTKQVSISHLHKGVYLINLRKKSGEVLSRAKIVVP